VKIAIMTLAVTQLMNAAFIVPLQHAGLALATSLGACLNAFYLYRKLREHDIYQPQPGWAVFAAKVTLAVGLMAATLYAAMGPEQWWLASQGMARGAALGAMVVLGAGVYFGALWLLGFRPGDFRRSTA
jgi:putative peptidoglycan lipid II flippase